MDKRLIKILVIEDDPDVTNLLKDIFQTKDYEVYFFSSGNNALQEIKNIMPNLIIMDIMMPGMTGFDICKNIRETNEINKIPILAITGYDSPENRKKIFTSGIDDYLPKPFDIKTLLKKIDNLIFIS